MARPGRLTERTTSNSVTWEKGNDLTATRGSRVERTKREAVAVLFENDLVSGSGMASRWTEPPAQQRMKRVAALPGDLGDIHRDSHEPSQVLTPIGYEGHLTLGQAPVAVAVQEDQG